MSTAASISAEKRDAAALKTDDDAGFTAVVYAAGRDLAAQLKGLPARVEKLTQPTISGFREPEGNYCVVWSGGISPKSQSFLQYLVQRGVGVAIQPAVDRTTRRILWELKDIARRTNGDLEVVERADEIAQAVRLLLSERPASAAALGASLRVAERQFRLALTAIESPPGLAVEVLKAKASAPAKAEENRDAFKALNATRGLQLANTDLRDKRTGLLDAEPVMKLFGLKSAQMAQKVLKVSGEALRKRTVSQRHQETLEQLATIAGLRALLENPEDLKVWLNTSNPELDDQKPIDLILQGRVETVASLAVDLLTGRSA